MSAVPVSPVPAGQDVVMTVDELYAALLLERFGPIPWRERYRKPLPNVVRVSEPALVTAARRRVLGCDWHEEAA